MSSGAPVRNLLNPGEAQAALRALERGLVNVRVQSVRHSIGSMVMLECESTANTPDKQWSIFLECADWELSRVGKVLVDSSAPPDEIARVMQTLVGEEISVATLESTGRISVQFGAGLLLAATRTSSELTGSYEQWSVGRLSSSTYLTCLGNGRFEESTSSKVE